MNESEKSPAVDSSLTLGTSQQIPGAAASPGKAGAPTPDDSAHLTGSFGKLVYAIVLVLMTALFTWFWFAAIDALEAVSHVETTVPWALPENATLKAGPIGFRYDVSKKSLINTGPMDAKKKATLVELLTVTGARAEEVRQSFYAALDELATKARSGNRSAVLMLLITGGLSGVLGVQLRSLTNFVGIACVLNALDMHRWWPYYFVRPFSGFVLGLVIVIAVQAGLYQTTLGVSTEAIWWVAISLLAGFGADEFTQRLRLISQTLFGESKAAKTQANPAASPKPATKEA